MPREYSGMDSHIEWPTPELAALISSGKIARDAHVLDLGAGLGTEAIMLARYGCMVVAIEQKAEARRELAARCVAAGVRDRVRVPNRKPYIDALRYRGPRAGLFDVVIDRLLLHNLGKSGVRLVRTMAHALRPEGLLVVRTRLDREGVSQDLTGDWGYVPLRAAVVETVTRRELKVYFRLGVPVQFAALVSDPVQAAGAFVVTTLPMAILVGHRNDEPLDRRTTPGPEGRRRRARAR